MSSKNFLVTAAVLASGFFAGSVAANAQPLYDKVIVDLPYAARVGDTVLQPGHYVIRQMDDGGANSRVLMIFSHDGMKLATTSMTIATEDPNTPEHTSVVLRHAGNDYYLDKVWIQGKNYGYEFVIPREVKSRTTEETASSSTVGATYAPTAEKEENETTAQVTQPAEPAPPPPPVAETPAPAPEPQLEAQNTPPPAPEETTPAPAPVMPQTAGNWLALMLSGSMLCGAGLLLRRLRLA